MLSNNEVLALEAMRRRSVLLTERDLKAMEARGRRWRELSRRWIDWSVVTDSSSLITGSMGHLHFWDKRAQSGSSLPSIRRGDREAGWPSAWVGGYVAFCCDSIRGKHFPTLKEAHVHIEAVYSRAARRQTRNPRVCCRLRAGPSHRLTTARKRLALTWRAVSLFADRQQSSPISRPNVTQNGLLGCDLAFRKHGCLPVSCAVEPLALVRVCQSHSASFGETGERISIATGHTKQLQNLQSPGTPTCSMHWRRRPLFKRAMARATPSSRSPHGPSRSSQVGRVTVSDG